MHKSIGINTIWKNYKANKSQDDKNQLISYYFHIVNQLSTKAAAKTDYKLQPEELMSYGYQGLVDAIEKYDLTMNIKFQTYASRRISGSILDGMRDMDHIPRSTRLAHSIFLRHKVRLQNHFSRHLSDMEVCHMLGMREKDIQKLYRYIPPQFESLSTVANHNNQEQISYSNHKNLVDYKQPMPDKHIIQNESFQNIIEDKLTNIEKKIVENYYYDDMTMDDIAQTMGLSASRISQIHQNAIRKLQQDFIGT